MDGKHEKQQAIKLYTYIDIGTYMAFNERNNAMPHTYYRTIIYIIIIMEYNNRQVHTTDVYYTSGKIIKLVLNDKFEKCNTCMYIYTS